MYRARALAHAAFIVGLLRVACECARVFISLSSRAPQKKMCFVPAAGRLPVEFLASITTTRHRNRAGRVRAGLDDDHGAGRRRRWGMGGHVVTRSGINGHGIAAKN